jgi:hypothetical protein
MDQVSLAKEVAEAVVLLVPAESSFLINPAFIVNGGWATGDYI